MANLIHMPRMSDQMQTGKIIKWYKNVGERIQLGDLLAEIETDKAIMEFESLWEGLLLHRVGEGVIKVEELIAVIGEDGENWEVIGNHNLDKAEDELEKEEISILIKEILGKYSKKSLDINSLNFKELLIELKIFLKESNEV